MPQLVLQQAAHAKIHIDRDRNEAAHSALLGDPACDGQC
jgi:hypothetical protein